jgi:catechol 2,3-dioxygenase-like lactoylglutathione lyase family enzyme
MSEPIPQRVSMLMLGCTDLARSLHFYETLLGFRKLGGVGDLLFLDAGNVRIGLNAGLARARPVGEESFEIVLATESVRSEFERLRAAGAAVLYEPRSIDGTNEVANVADPDGHVVSLFGPP